MKKKILKEIIADELVSVLLESITKNFTKAIETYKKIQLNQQELRKAFVSEKDPKKKEKLKQGLIKMHAQVVKAEKDFNKALQTEPIEDELTEKSKGLWANIHAKRKRGEKPAHKNSKAHKDAVKAAKSINKEGKVNEALARGLKPLLTIGSKITKKVGEDALVKLSDKFDRIDDEYADEIASTLNMAIEKMQDGYASQATGWLKRFNKECKQALKGKPTKSAFEGVNEGKLNEDFSQRAANFRVNLRMRMKDLKIGGKILAYKMTFTKVGDNKFNWNGKQLWDTEAVVKKIKLAAVKDIMKWKQGASGAPMVKAFLTIKEGKLNEGKLNEDVWKSFLGDDSAFKLHMATNTEKRKSVKARKTDKTWDDGVPVLKYIARASKKDSPLPKGKFKIIEDNKHGWWYYQVGNIWYGISQKDYGTPPFEY